jgi:hypothetical protein
MARRTNEVLDLEEAEGKRRSGESSSAEAEAARATQKGSDALCLRVAFATPATLN